jgi:manganese transport protein
VAAGADATRSLVISQVILSLVLPVPMVALLLLSRRRAVMGAFVTGRTMSLLAAAATVVTLVLNAVLLVQIVQG